MHDLMCVKGMLFCFFYIYIATCTLISYSVQKMEFRKAKWVNDRAKWVMGNTKEVNLSSITEKLNRQEKKQILSRPQTLWEEEVVEFSYMSGGAMAILRQIS